MLISVKFEESFFNEENRCDYLVSSKMKKIWAVQIDLANKVINVCKKYGINIYAYAGTLLGAVRHNGYIPWDDDMDFCMLRGDYERFVKIAPKEFKDPYFLQNHITDSKFFIGYSRLRNSSTTAIINGEASLEYNNGVYIDIFVLDGYCQNDLKLEKQIIQKKKIERMLFFYFLSTNKKNNLKEWGKRLVRFVLKKLVSEKKLINYYNRCITRYNEDENRVTLMTHVDKFLHKYYCYKDELGEALWLDFENIKVPVPNNYQAILSRIYGNYMSFPPIEERGKWHNDMIIFEPDVPYKQYILNNKL